jgi:hypothetical protein
MPGHAAGCCEENVSVCLGGLRSETYSSGWTLNVRHAIGRQNIACTLKHGPRFQAILRDLTPQVHRNCRSRLFTLHIQLNFLLETLQVLCTAYILSIGLARTIYSIYTCGVFTYFCRELINFTVMNGVCIRFWLTLPIYIMNTTKMFSPSH